MNEAASLFRLLGDSLRLRILRLLARQKLNVSELTGILGVAQSGVSRHLRLLREAGLVSEDREAGWAYYEVDSARFSDGLARFWPALKDQLQSLEERRQDDIRLQEVLRERKEDFREKTTRGICPGRSWAAWARTLSYLIPETVVADLGCGQGYLAMEAARWARKVIAIDNSRVMLSHARELVRRHRLNNITFKYGQIEQLPLQNQSVDVVLLAQVLHCLEQPAAGLREAFRILKPGGALLLQELRTHQEEWVRSKLDDKWLGFEEKDLRTLLRQSGFARIRLDIGSKRRGDPFTVLIGFGRKAA